MKAAIDINPLGLNAREGAHLIQSGLQRMAVIRIALQPFMAPERQRSLFCLREHKKGRGMTPRPSPDLPLLSLAVQ